MNLTRKIELLDQQIADAKNGLPDDFNGWRNDTDVVLRTVLGNDAPLHAKFKKISYTSQVWVAGMDTSGYRPAGVRRAIAILQAAKKELALQSELEPSLTIDEPSSNEPSVPGSIFVVHGHDDARKHEVARFLQRVTKSEPVILHEQASGNRTVIEKLEKHAGTASFAVVLLTADDLGQAKTADTLIPRARQNVVFEAGYFIGRLGRDRVTLLLEKGVERPGDLDGVVYIALDMPGAWKTALLREMAAAGLAVDWEALGR